VRSAIDILFTDEIVSEEQINSIKEGFKTLKSFAQLNMKFLDARSQAENARQVLDEALKSPNSEIKAPVEVPVEAPVESVSDVLPEVLSAEEPVTEAIVEVQVPVEKSTKFSKK
jgi:hypothetical protein